MSVRFLLLLIISRWVVLSKASPAIISRSDESIQSDNDNFLNQYSLPDFSQASSDIDVKKTIEQVENILKANPSLPRLSKKDILTLLNNITTEDKIKDQTKSGIGKDATLSDERPLMIVLPFKAGNNPNKDVKDLFTKPPIVRYINTKSHKAKGDTDNARINFLNHKYKDEETADKTKNPVENNFWHDQAQKVMNALKKQNDKSNLNMLKGMPFKKMPENIHFFEDINGESTKQYENLVKLQLEDKVNLSSKPLGPSDIEDMLSSVDIYRDNRVVEKLPFKYLDDTKTAENVFVSQSSGLLDQIPQESISTSPDTSAYAAFKPLPLGNEYTDNEKKQPIDLDEILNKYGLLGSVDEEYLPLPQIRDPEITKNYDYLKNTEFVETDIYPADMASMLTEMGLARKGGIRQLTYLPSIETTSETNKKEPGKKDSESSVLGSGPDPMSIEEINDIDIKTEGQMTKRQQSNITTTVEPDAEIVPVDLLLINSTTSRTDDDGKVVGSKEESSSSEAPNLAELEESFGASPADGDPSEAELPPPRRNGFYYMLDWNSFLEVGDGDTKVNIRFNPKLGDPQRFLAVSVP